MSERFFVNSVISGDRAILEGIEAHHLAHVMRAKPGDQVTLFDGSGSEFDVRIEQVGKSSVELSITSRRDVDRESAMRLTLAVALPKGDRQQWLVEKAVELGVAEIVPIIAERSVAQPTASAITRLRRSVIEASKQCGRNRLLEIAEPQPWTNFATAAHRDQLRLIAHPGGSLLRSVWGDNDAVGPSQAAIAAIGPEGGFSEKEVELATNSGWIK